MENEKREYKKGGQEDLKEGWCKIKRTTLKTLIKVKD